MGGAPGGAVTRATLSGFLNRNPLESSSHSLGSAGKNVNDPPCFVFFFSVGSALSRAARTTTLRSALFPHRLLRIRGHRQEKAAAVADMSTRPREVECDGFPSEFGPQLVSEFRRENTSVQYMSETCFKQLEYVQYQLRVV